MSALKTVHRKARGKGKAWGGALVAVLGVLLATFSFPGTVLAQAYGGYNIDGTIPDNAGVAFFSDPFGSVNELGPDNGASNKLTVVHAAAPPMLEAKNATDKGDLKGVWLDVNTDDSGDVWLYGAWDRVSNVGSTILFFEFQQNTIPLGCDYSASDATLIANCNPFENRQPGDFLIVWDIQGGATDIGLRTFGFVDDSPANGQWDGQDDEPLTLGPLVTLNSTQATAAFGPNDFSGEFAINLSATIFQQSPDVCLSVANLIPGTVTGNSDTADYVDVVLGDFGSAIGISSCGQVRVTKETEPDGLTGTFPYTLTRTDGSAIEFGANPAVSASGTLTGDGDADLYVDLKVGSNYTLTEGALVSPWELTGILCESDGDYYDVFPGGASFEVMASVTTSCVITNLLPTGQLVIIKDLVQDNGGDETVEDFDYVVDDISYGENDVAATAFPASGIVTFTLPVGTYDVSEPSVDGYTTTYDSDQIPDSCTSLEVTKNGTTTCTITNDDDAPSLTLVKEVTNDNGGTAIASQWTLTATGPTGFSGAGPTVNSGVSFDQGTYVLSEGNGPEGYSASSWVCVGDGSQTDDAITLDLGESATCTITNDDDAPSLTLVKEVTNDNGGTAVASDWTLTAAGYDAGNPQVGTYDLSESGGPEGYTQTSLTCDNAQGQVTSVTLGLGEDVTCTFVNDDDAPSLTLVKEVINDNGGTAVASDWTLTAAGYSAASPQVGTYDLSESGGPEGYTQTSLTCDNATGQVSSVSLGLGEDVTCTFVNDDDAPSLTLVKEVTNNNGGTAIASQWTLTATGPTGFSGAGPTVNSGVSFDQGTYVLSEGNGPEGYSASSWVCVGDGSQTDDAITLDLGESATCTITNDDDAPSLTLVKEVTNDNGGTAVASDWTLTAAGYDAGNPQVGTYDLSESGGPEGYTQTSLTCDNAQGQVTSVTLGLGEDVTCTFVNDDDAPSLTLVKEVINDNGGTAVASDWTLTAAGYSAASPQVGTYDLSESGGPEGYTQTSLTCDNATGQVSSVSLGLGEDVTCTFVNDDDAPSLTLVKEVTNNNGGTAIASQWTLTATGPTGFSGAGPTVNSGVSFDQGTYVLSEGNGPEGYSASSWVCVGDGSQTDDAITLDLGESATCTITNDDDAPSLTLVKEVTNDNGGTAVASDWTLTAAGYDAGNPQVGTYDLSESGGPEGYTQTSLTCDNAQGQVTSVTLGLGEDVTCTFVNDDDAPSLTLVKEVINDNGGTAVASDWTLTAAGYSAASPQVGTYDLSESGGPEGYTQTSLTCDNAQGQVTSVTLGLGEDVTCTFVNDDEPGTLIVTKVTTVESEQDFSFEVMTDAGIIPSGSFTLTGGNSEQLIVDAGSYTVTEGTTFGWGLLSAGCVQPDLITSAFVEADYAQPVSIGNGEVWECTFTNDPQPDIEVTKTADTTVVIGTSGEVTFTVDVDNVGPETVYLTVLTDTVYGDLNGQGTCDVEPPIELASGATYSCVFSTTVTGDESTPHMNTITATAFSQQEEEVKDSDDETVIFDQLPGLSVTKTAQQSVVVGTSGDVTFEIVVNNTGPVSLTLTSLTDTDFGNLSGQGTCSVPQVIGVGGSYSCTFTGTVTGDENTVHENTATAAGEDKDGNEASDNDDETVIFDQLPGLSVTKTAQQPVVVGTSGTVTFTILVENTGPVPLTLTSLTDSDFGDLTQAQATTCSVPQQLAAVNGSYSCTFQGTVTGDENTPHENTATAIGEDTGGNETSDSDDETVIFDEMPEVTVAKIANSTQVVGPSAEVTFTVIVTNTGPVPVTLTELTDSDFGDLNGQGTCSVPQENLAPNDVYTCTFTQVVDAADENPHENTVTAVVVDKDEHESSATDDATVVIVLRATTGDFVWFDDDEDGIQDAGEQGVADVVVRLFRDNFDGEPVSTTTTDESGKYLFTELEPGTYCLEFDVPEDFAVSPANQTDEALDSDGETTVNATIVRTDCFELTGGEVDLTRDLGIFEDSTPTGEQPGEQPQDGTRYLFLPNLQASSNAGADLNAQSDADSIAAQKAAVDEVDEMEYVYLPTLEQN